MSKITEFYAGTGTDHAGRTLADIMAFDDVELERVHDFIQWMFPLREASRFNPNAPILTQQDVDEFLSSAKLQDNLLASLRKMCAFYGLSLDRNENDTGWDMTLVADGKPWWASPHDHNLLRLTRILTSTRVLGLKGMSSMLLMHLEQIARSYPGSIPGSTIKFWKATKEAS